ncbi:MAG: hypothetical protein ACJ786_19260 [Catenulispora sp.]
MSSPELTPAQRRAETVAKLLDLRMFIGSLFVVFGILVTFRGLTASAAEIAKAAGINLSLWTGLLMLATGIVFVAWTLISPPAVMHGHEMTEDDLPEQLRHQGLEEVPEHHREPPDEPPPGRRRRGPAH